MNPKKNLPEGSKELVEISRYILVETILNKKPYYMIYEFFESKNGRRYWTRGGGNSDFETVKSELERITGSKIRKAETQ